MNRRLLFLCLPVLLLVAANLMAASAMAAPVFDVKAVWGDTNLPPGSQGQFTVQVRNLGDEAASEEALTITDQLPEGVTITGFAGDPVEGGPMSCSGVGTGVATCTVPGANVPSMLPHPGLGADGTIAASPTGYAPVLFIEVAVDPGVSGSHINKATVSGGGAPPAEDVDAIAFGEGPAKFGLVPGSFQSDVFDTAYPFGSPVRQAGAHPFEQRVNFDLNAKTAIASDDGTRETNTVGLIRTAEVTLPRGMIGNPEATPKCDPVDFATEGAVSMSTACPPDTQVGYATISIRPGGARWGMGSFVNANAVSQRVAIYNLVPPKGVTADFAFNASFVQAHIYPILDPAQDYAIKTVTPAIINAYRVRGSEVTFWGVPADPAHDKFRYFPKDEEGQVLGAPWGSAPIRPLLTNPVDCGFENGGARIRVDSYTDPGNFTPVEEYGNPLDVEGCNDPRFRFEPKISMQPTDRHADAPTGLDVHLEVPQRNDQVASAGELYAQNGAVKAIPTPPLKKAVVTFPEGMTLSPSAAQGLGSCSSEQIGLGTDKPVTCPDNSQYGTLTLHTPILPVDAQPEGFIYIAKQGDNPFHNFLSLYLVIEEPERGILVKIPGRLDLDSQTGRITTTFDDLPQFPVSDMQLSFKGGLRAGLVQPSTCGKKTIESEFFTWQDPSTPHRVKTSYEITEKPSGSPCVNSLGERPFAPSLDAGSTDSTAGEYSPFAFRLARTDDDQEFSQLGVTLPPGLAAKFAGVSLCPEAGIGQAFSRETTAGAGALEQSDPSCPASSQIGTTEVGAGVGVPLAWIPGKVYLAGPYRGAPLSMVVISPATVGPYDLGVIAVRTALHVDPATAQGKAVTDPFPQIFQGIPVRIRDIRLKLNRPGFTLNPTSCEPKQITAHVTGTGGDLRSTADDTAVDLANRFQVADCASLGFRPKLSLRLFGGTRRAAHPRLRAVLQMPSGGANIASSSVALPHSEFLDQGSLNRVCTRVQFAAKACPQGSIYGHAVAKTPLFDFPLTGNVYLGTGYGHKLPDLVAELKGPAWMPVEIDLDGRIDELKGGIRTTFDSVPDAPVSKFVLVMRGGKRGLIENSTSLCLRTRRATVRFTGQNGKVEGMRPLLKVACKGNGKKHRGRKPHHRRH